MTIPEKFREALVGLKSLAIGLGITGKAFAEANVTVIYPREEVDNLASFRGHVELVGREDMPAVPRCVACGACVKACPSNCLSILAPIPPKEGDTGPVKLGPVPQKGSKTPGAVLLDFSLCSLCGQCVKTCPVDSLRFSHHAYFVATRREEMRLDLLERLRGQIGG